MNDDDLRRHLTGSGAASTEGRGGSGRGTDDQMMALSVVSTDVGRLGQRVDDLIAQVQELHQGQEQQKELPAQVQELHQGREQQEELSDKVGALADKVSDIADAVAELQARADAAPPPQPWDWASMSQEEAAQATLMLAEWVETTLTPWWPRVVGTEGLPPCWVQHPDMLRSVSLVMVSYQMAYEHPGKRVHHEVDFRRTLEDMMRDVGRAAETYRCRPKGKETRHVTTHGVRPERERAREHLRTRALAWIGEADRAGDQERVTELMETYRVSPDHLRRHMAKLYNNIIKALKNDSLSGDDLTRSVCEAGRLLDVYRVVDVDSLEDAPDLEMLLKQLYVADRDRFQVLRTVYEPVIRRYTVIGEHLGQMLRGQRTQYGADLMARYGITDADLDRVRAMLLK